MLFVTRARWLLIAVVATGLFIGGLSVGASAASSQLVVNGGFESGRSP